MAAAFFLPREGHSVTICDRNHEAGGTLRDLPESQVPSSVRQAEIGVLARMGIEFKFGVALGEDLTVEGLGRGFDAILLTIGEILDQDAARLGIPLAGKNIK